MLEMIVAHAENGVIGNAGTMPWHIPEDLKHFKTVTTGAAVIMGRKTFESIGRALPKRRNIVITRQPDYVAAGCTVVPSLDAALKAAGAEPRVFIIGGGEIYRQALPLADRLWITEIATAPNSPRMKTVLPCVFCGWIAVIKPQRRPFSRVRAAVPA